jgi:hypothetical protein
MDARHARAAPRCRKMTAGRPGKDIAMLVHVAACERAESARARVSLAIAHARRSTSRQPGRPVGPQLFLRLDEESERILVNENPLTKRGGIGIWRVHAEQPDGDLGRAMAQVANSRSRNGMARLRRRRKLCGPTSRPAARYARTRGHRSDSVRFRMMTARRGITDATRHTGV